MAAKSLEDTLRLLAKQGELNYISVVPLPLKGAPGNVGFSTTYAPATNCGHGFGMSADPVESILLAIDDWKSQKRALPKTKGPEIIAEPFNAERDGTVGYEPGEVGELVQPLMPKKPNQEVGQEHLESEVLTGKVANPWE